MNLKMRTWVIKLSSAGSSPEGVVVDAMAKLLFYTDNGRNTINVARTDNSGDHLIIITYAKHPRTIQIDPMRRYRACWAILWGHSGPLCHALSLLSSSSSLSMLLWTSMRKRRATVATPGEWQCGVRRIAVANGPNIFQMLLVD